MYRSHDCGVLNLNFVGQNVTLAGWVQRVRNLGGMTFIDLRDRYGLTQLVFNMDADAELCERARKLGREFVLQVHGTVSERSNKNTKLATGEVEVIVTSFKVLNSSLTPPFTIEDETDGGDDLRMKYRYLDLRRNIVKEKIILRHRIATETRKYLDTLGFLEIETPVLIKSTPEGARDFVVPSRLNPGQFYALPQSPQTFKQILMVAGFDKYFQIVRCFRDEDLRADRQPEFTQIDCEMSFVERDDVLQVFEGLTRHLFRTILNIDPGNYPRMTYTDAMKYYGTDKPDLRFNMRFVELNDVAKGKNFNAFDSAELIAGICASGCAEFTRKQIDELTDYVKRPQIGAKGLVYIRFATDGSAKSSIDKFFTEDDLKKIGEQFSARAGDLVLIIAGDTKTTRTALSELRLKLGNDLGLRDRTKFAPLWVLDFPLFEWSDENRWHAVHHPFTSPNPDDIHLLDSDPGKVRANAYDLVVNGVELGGGSIRIHDKQLQKKVFSILGFTEQEAQDQFGFLMNAFEYGAPPHGGLALGFDRMCALYGNNTESIRDFIAFPKNNSGRDMMIDAPSPISTKQLNELGIAIIQS